MCFLLKHNFTQQKQNDSDDTYAKTHYHSLSEPVMHDSGNVLIPIPIPGLLQKPDSDSDSWITLKAIMSEICLYPCLMYTVRTNLNFSFKK